MKFQRKWGIPMESWRDSELVTKSPEITYTELDSEDDTLDPEYKPKYEMEAEILDWMNRELGWKYINEMWEYIRYAYLKKTKDGKERWRFRFTEDHVSPREANLYHMEL